MLEEEGDGVVLGGGRVEQVGANVGEMVRVVDVL